MSGDTHEAEVFPVPLGLGESRSAMRGMRCPECEHVLPVDATTECDECGAHLRLLVEVVAPAQVTGVGERE